MGSNYNFLSDRKGGGYPLSSKIALLPLNKRISSACYSTGCHYGLLHNSFSFSSSYIYKY